jgi:hypothetical protein
MVGTAGLAGMGAIDRTPVLRRVTCSADVGAMSGIECTL